MPRRREQGGSSEQRQIDPFQASINQFNRSLYTETFNADFVRKSLMDVQTVGFQTKNVAPDKIFDRLHVLALQAAMIAKEKEDPSAEEFTTFADSYRVALDNFATLTTQATEHAALVNAPLNYPPMIGKKGQ